MIETQKLYIRSFTEADKEYFRQLCNEDSKLGKLLKELPDGFDIIYWKSILESKDEIFLIFDKNTNTFYGKIELQHFSPTKELGIALLKDHQNKGIGTEAIIGFCDWLYTNKKLSELNIRIDPENKRSQHIFKKLGAEFIGQKSGLTQAEEQMLLYSNSNLDLDSIGPYFYKLGLPLSK